MLKYIALQIKTTNSDTMNPLFSQIAFDEKKKENKLLLSGKTLIHVIHRSSYLLTLASFK